jgi:hypothetical protein
MGLRRKNRDDHLYDRTNDPSLILIRLWAMKNSKQEKGTFVQDRDKKQSTSKGGANRDCRAKLREAWQG